ncbi:MAG: DJ-1/PfpI family protein [Lentimonas sp.]
MLFEDAGLLQGTHYTAHTSTSNELPNAKPQTIVQDGQLLTSRGAGTAIEFALALVRNLCGNDCARNIAEAICWPHSIPTDND